MKRATMYLFLAAGICTATACGGNGSGSAGGPDSMDTKKEAKAQNDTALDNSGIKKDANFAVEAADGGMLEVQLGQLAQTNGHTEAVKKFGKEMVDDHGKAGDELKNLASQKGIALPAALSDKCQKKYNDLAAKKGADFDKAYMDMMVSDHKDDIDEFRKESEKGNDADLKAWAQQKLPVLQHHLDMAEQTQKSVKK